jgi:hypothetical protein
MRHVNENFTAHILWIVEQWSALREPHRSGADNQWVRTECFVIEETPMQFMRVSGTCCA